MDKSNNLRRFADNLRTERESVALYRVLAEAEHDSRLAEVYRRLAAVEEGHARFWEERLRELGVAPPAHRLGWRVRTIAWLARRFGVGVVLPIIAGAERSATHAYEGQPEAVAAGMPADERSHARIFSELRATTPGGLAGTALAQLEGRHRNTGGGNALRAAVLGASDGLTSNLSLVMGVAGATMAGRAVLVTGFAGLLAGALSMAIGEWLSVQSARELYGHQIAIERAELEEVPDEEREELALIYQAKGADAATARTLADRLLQDHTSALETLAREELGIDPTELGGSAWEAAGASFLLFSLGALVPVLPFIFMVGMGAVGVSLALSVIGLFLIGAGITLTTGVPLLKSGGRQILLGMAAAAITFGLGRLVGGHLG